MYEIRVSSKCKKDIRRCVKQSKNTQLLKDINSLLVAGSPLPQKNKDHNLTGSWDGHRECHIQPDWLLIYKVCEEENIIQYVRTGSHSELYG